jgi:hypothetical protein
MPARKVHTETDRPKITFGSQFIFMSVKHTPSRQVWFGKCPGALTTAQADTLSVRATYVQKIIKLQFTLACIDKKLKYLDQFKKLADC